MNELAPCPSQKDFPKYGPMSLWDMLRKYAKEFFLLADFIGEVQRFKPTQPRNALIALGQMPEEQFNKIMLAYLPALQTLSEVIPLQSVQPQLKRIERKMSRGHTQDEIVVLLGELSNRLRDDLDQQWFFHVRPENVDSYRSTTPFGQPVFDGFKPARSDIEAASKCLALAQNTACVFHLMRAMESIVKQLCETLGVEEVEVEWGPLLGSLKPKIEAMKKDEKRKKWLEVHSLLYNVKEAWRNETMHPKASYSDEEAAEIYTAVKAFTKSFVSLV